MSKRVYVISDLHLGGKPGFRMMKHPERLAAFIERLASKATPSDPVELVINGDFVYFLAQEHDGGGPRWTPFAFEEGAALRAFDAIAAGMDKPIFSALAKLVKTCRLTIMLGNHDLELALPEVRDRLLSLLGDAPAQNIRFQYDGEALVIGDAIIEHGNAQDPANAVDFNGLRYLRAIRTRGYYQASLQQRAFTAPPGSDLVARVMNPIKERYPFIDLLKPESEPLFALLLALEPDSRGELTKLVSTIRGIAKNLVPKLGFPVQLANVSAGATEVETAVDPLLEYIAAALPKDEAQKSFAAPPAGVTLENVSAASWLESKLGLFRLLMSGKTDAAEADLTSRLPALRQAFRALEDDPTWNENVESGKRYLDAAKALASGDAYRRGYRWVVFGHTHHAKRVELPDEGSVYLNSGTWANLMRFPELAADDVSAMATILQFAEDLKSGAYADEVGIDAPPSAHARQIFYPTYVRLDLSDDERVVRSATVGVYDWKTDTFD